MSALAILAARPLFVLGYCDRVEPATTDVRYVRSSRLHSAVYRGSACGRCKGPMQAVSQYAWCPACVALPCCDECGTPDVDDPECPSCAQYDACDDEHDEYISVSRRGGGYRGYDAPYTP